MLSVSVANYNFIPHRAGIYKECPAKALSHYLSTKEIDLSYFQSDFSSLS